MTASIPLIFGALLLADPVPPAGSPFPTAEQEQLAAIETASHQDWHNGDTEALAALMAPEYHFVVMNGALEGRAEIVGGAGASAGRRPLQVRSLRVEPERVAIRGTTATVISELHVDASARGRQLPPRMRILSVFVREDSGWKLFARSITPVLGGAGED